MGGTATSLTIGLAAPADLPGGVGARLRPRLRRRVRQGRRQRRRRRPDPLRDAGHRGHRDRLLHGGAGAALGCASPATSSRSSAARAGPPAGLAVLGRGFRSPRVLVEAYRRPEPPYAAGPVAADAGATAMIDVSDGLLADARHIADASGVVDRHPARRVRDRRAAARGRCRARRRPAAVHPRRGRRPPAAGLLPVRGRRTRRLDGHRRRRRAGETARRHRRRCAVRRPHRLDPLLSASALSLG